MSPFTYKETKLTENNYLYMINIEDIDSVLKDYIDKNLIKICKGKRDIKVETVKKELLTYLEKKNKSNLLTGSIAEFFIHLFLSEKKFKQEFLYFNLEEGSIKKGFDGYYTKADEQWIVESKSGVFTAKNTIYHPDKITEAYGGLKDKIEGKDNTNNPWENAYNHAANISVKTSKSITDMLSMLSEEYTNETYRKIDDFNIIPCSTIFLEENWETINYEELAKKVNSNISSKSFKKIIVICLNKKSLRALIDCLRC